MTEVWDCFLFNDEIDLLEFRMLELEDVVDHFVIVEGDRNMRGTPKPSHFATHQERFERWRSRGQIEHVIVTLPGAAATNARREAVQHQGISGALRNARPDDLIVVGDMDEIPDRALLRELKETLRVPTLLRLQHALYAANLRAPQPWCEGSKACRANQLEHPDMELLLGLHEAPFKSPTGHAIDGRGWHLSFMGSSAAVQKKLSDYVHAEVDGRLTRDRAHIDRCRRYGVELRGEYGLHKMKPVDLDAMLIRLRSGWPELFDFRYSPRIQRLTFLAWAHLRADRLPAHIVQRAERRLGVTLLLVGAPLVVVDQTRRFAERHRLRRRLRMVLHRFR